LLKEANVKNCLKPTLINRLKSGF